MKNKYKFLSVFWISLAMFPATASEQCLQLRTGVNYTIENQVSRFCFDSDIESITYAYHDANFVIDKNELSLSTYGQGVLFNVLIELKNDESFEATFLTIESPPIKQVITTDKDTGSVEIISISADCKV